MSWPEENRGPVPPRITTRTWSSFLGPTEGVVQLDQQAPVLRVAGVGAVEEDPDDPAVVERLELQELIVGHGGASPLCGDAAVGELVAFVTETPLGRPHGIPRLGGRRAEGRPADSPPFLRSGALRPHPGLGVASGPSRSATRALRLSFMASLRGRTSTNSTVFGTLYDASLGLGERMMSSSSGGLPGRRPAARWHAPDGPTPGPAAR